MKASELRIGNIVMAIYNDKEKVVEVESIADWGINVEYYGYGAEHELEKIHGIQLTEEWLLKFGFEESPVFVSGLWLIMEADLSFRFVKNYIELWDLEKIKTFYDMKVHQLQNLYFALTGEELTLKE